MDRRKGQVMAVSAILIILLLVSTASFYYTYIVPDTSETKEQAHMNDVENSILSFRSDIQSIYTQAPKSWDNDTYQVRNGLAAFYPMDRGKTNTIPDRSGNSNHASLRNGAIWSFPGLREHGTLYDSYSEEAYVSGSGSLDFSGGQYLTVSAWVKKSEQSSGCCDTIASQPGGAFQLRTENWDGKNIEFMVHDKGHKNWYTVCENRRTCTWRTGKNCWYRGSRKRVCDDWNRPKKPKDCWYVGNRKRICDSYRYRDCWYRTVCWQEYNWVSGNWVGDGGNFNAELPTYDDWHHVTGVLRNNQMEIWVNGEKKDTRSFSGQIRTRDWQSSDVYIGNNPDAWHGELDNVRIYDRALSKQEIQNLATRFNPPAEVSKTVDLSGASAMMSGVKNQGTIQTSDTSTRVRVLYNLNYCSDPNNKKFVDVGVGSTSFSFDNNYYPDQKYVFENGAIIREQEGSAEMLQGPFIDFSRGGVPQVDLTVADVEGIQDISGDTTATTSASFERYFEEDNSFNNRMAVEIESSYPEAWESYMRNEVESTGIGTVTRNGNKVRACVNQASLNIKYGELKINAK